MSVASEIAALATGLEAIADVKSDIGVAMTDLGLDVSAVAFTGYAPLLLTLGGGAPTVIGTIGSQEFTGDTGVETVATAQAFSGTGLVFSLTTPPTGVTIDSATGIVSVDKGSTGTLAATITVAAANSLGSISTTFALAVTAAVAAPENEVAPTLDGTGLPGDIVTLDPGIFTGNPVPTITREWRLDMQPTGDTGPDFTPTIEQRFANLTCVVTATNSEGSASVETTGIEITVPAPAAVGAIDALDLDVSATALIFDVSPYFSVEADPDQESVTWSVTGTGASVDDDTQPFVTIDRSSPIATTTITVTATNPSGSDTQDIGLTVTGSQDTTPPILSGATNTATKLGYVTDEANGNFHWLLTDTALTGTDTEKKAAVIAGGGIDSGFIDVAGGTQTDTMAATGLSGTHYVYTVHEDDAVNKSNLIETIINIIAADTTAPVLTPGTLTFGTTTAERPVSTDEGEGFLWRYVIATASALTGTNDEKADAIKAAGLSVPVTATGAQGAQTWTGLTPATAYTFYLMQEDLSGNKSTVSEGTFTTNAVGAGALEEQSVLVISDTGERAPGYEYTGDITIGSAPNRVVFAHVHGFNLTAESTNAVPGAVTISLGGVAMTEVGAPELAPSARVWSALYRVVNPTTGVRQLSVAVDRTQRGMAVTLVEVCKVDQTTPVEFVADTIKNAEGSSLAAVQDFPSRTLAASGNLLLGMISIDTGAAALPTARGGTMLVADKTGTAGTSDVTHGVATRDTTGVIGFAMDTNRRAILRMIEVRAA